MTPQFKALLVHLFTATGAVFAMLAMLAAADQKWSLMFLWLVVAFFIDGFAFPLIAAWRWRRKWVCHPGMAMHWFPNDWAACRHCNLPQHRRSHRRVANLASGRPLSAAMT